MSDEVVRHRFVLDAYRESAGRFINSVGMRAHYEPIEKRGRMTLLPCKCMRVSRGRGTWRFANLQDRLRGDKP